MGKRPAGGLSGERSKTGENSTGVVGVKISARNSRADARSDTRARKHSQQQALDLPVLRRFQPGYRWDGVLLEPYKLSAHRGGEFRGASRQVLIGRGGERVRFHVRYFEIAPGGFTSLERHRHAHVVIGLRGRGRVRVGGKYYLMGRLDTIYIASDQPHQIAAAGRGPFGFMCIVDARRDRPRPVAEK